MYPKLYDFIWNLTQDDFEKLAEWWLTVEGGPQEIHSEIIKRQELLEKSLADFED